MNATLSQGFAYDATAILGFGPASAEPLPKPAPDEVVINYGGWSFQELRDSQIGKQLVDQQDWYDKYPWSREKVPASIYRLCIPIPGSNCKTFAEQERVLPHGEQVAPVVLVASALLAHHLQTKEDLLKGDFTRCTEQDADGDRVGLGWYGGRLRLNYFWFVCRFARVCLASAQKS